MDPVQQVLYNPLTDCLADFWNNVVPHEALVELIIPCLRRELLEYHEELLALGNQTPPVDVIDLTQD